jgi:hypothetical protein
MDENVLIECHHELHAGTLGANYIERCTVGSGGSAVKSDTEMYEGARHLPYRLGRTGQLSVAQDLVRKTRMCR